MHVLIVSATATEISPLVDFLKEQFTVTASNSFKNRGLELEILVTGVGMLAAAYALGSKLQNQHYSLMVQAGIAGSFNRDIQYGEVLEVSMERIADLGTENADESFSDIFEMGLEKPDSDIFSGGWLLPLKPIEIITGLKTVKGLTVNMVTGSNKTKDALQARYKPDTESMEGAACFYASAKTGVPCIQIRSISNYIEARNRDKWNIPLAIQNLNEYLIRFVEKLRDGA